MKLIFKFILIFFFVFNFTAVQPNTKIAYIDIDFIMKQSKAGQSITVALEDIHKKKIIEFNDLEIELKEEEKKILSKKNILNKEEFEKKIEDLRKKVNSYRTNRKSTIEIWKKVKTFEDQFWTQKYHDPDPKQKLRLSHACKKNKKM